MALVRLTLHYIDTNVVRSYTLAEDKAYALINFINEMQGDAPIDLVIRVQSTDF